MVHFVSTQASFVFRVQGLVQRRPFSLQGRLQLLVDGAMAESTCYVEDLCL